MYRNLKVAAILPCYNEEKLIGKTIETLPDFVDEIIAVDDKSKDGTWKVIQKIAKVNKRVRAIHHTDNTGAFATSRSTSRSRSRMAAPGS